jgi:tRNA (guanine37-N1)-methyltransferase
MMETTAFAVDYRIPLIGLSIIFLMKNIEYLVAMRIDIITIFPELLSEPFNHSIIKRAKAKNLVNIYLHQLRDFTTDKHKKIDDYAFSGGAGMVMMIEPIAACIESLKKERDYDEIIYTSPDGEMFDQPMANSMSLSQNIIILCGHYKGIDERIREHFITKEISIGNYVLSGGELAAAVITDALVRLLPGVLGNEVSALSDSFQNNLVAPPVYTRPRNFRGMQVPEVLLSGNEQLIEEWKHDQSLERTKVRRPDIIKE